MTYDLYIGDGQFSSWSLRGWLMLAAFDLPHRARMTSLYGGNFAKDMAPLAPAQLVPVLKTPQGEVIGESLAIAETLAERHPDAGLWPKDAALRARARWLCAEMASGFMDLRRDCPMQLKHVNAGFVASDAVSRDVARVEDIWTSARALTSQRLTSQGLTSRTEGWLLGDYSLADVFYTPVAARIIGYDLSVSESARAYCLRLLDLPAVRGWRAEGLKVDYNPAPYPSFDPLRPWPVD